MDRYWIPYVQRKGELRHAEDCRLEYRPGLAEQGLPDRLSCRGLPPIPFFYRGYTVRLPLGNAAQSGLSCGARHERAFLRRHDVKAYLPRTTTNGYIFGKLSACVLSGGVVLALGILAAYGISALLFTPMEAVPAEGAEAPAYFAELMGKVLLFFCSGAFWSLVGLLFATLTGSKYMAYASPFVIYYVLIILYERYFDTLYVLYPKEWLMPSNRWYFGNLSVAVWVGELIVIASLCFYPAAKRRLKQI